MDMQGALCFDDGYVGKQPMAWKEHCAEYWLKEVHESMDRFTGRRDVTETEITSKTIVKPCNRSINLYVKRQLKGNKNRNIFKLSYFSEMVHLPIYKIIRPVDDNEDRYKLLKILWTMEETRAVTEWDLISPIAL